MRFLAVFLFMSLGVMALTMLGERGTQRLREARPFVAMGWGVGIAPLSVLVTARGW
jgi:hypothetical protein